MIRAKERGWTPEKHMPSSLKRALCFLEGYVEMAFKQDFVPLLDQLHSKLKSCEPHFNYPQVATKSIEMHSRFRYDVNDRFKGKP